ncbi:NADP-dependent oxidoreductase domain-containing protein [Suillus ampliporus]|nr:NADP-dependent oxidoreductase domain-containing protein [Suillus ampliporus]
MHISVDASLKKLKTSDIHILYVHWWGWDTSIEEVMNGLHVLVQQGKVLYLGISDAPAWVVSKANQYTRDHGKSPFVIYQGAWNVMNRAFEREIIPMVRSEDLALAPWNVLAGGKLRTDEEEERRRQTGEKALEKVAKEVGAKHITAVAIAYLMQKMPYTNLKSLAISLTPEQVKYLESIVLFDPGFLNTMIVSYQCSVCQITEIVHLG